MDNKQIKTYENITCRYIPIRNYIRQRNNPQYPRLRPVNLEEGHKIHIQGKDVYLYRSVDSTNNIARSLAGEGLPDGTIVISERQTSGRGRRGRQWSCPPGRGILMSMIIRPRVDLQNIPLFTLLTGAVVAETIYKATGCVAGIKWPNDVIINRRKVCGILAESSITSKGALDYVIIGMGINVNLDKQHLPLDCMETSTSLKLELGQFVSRLSLISQFIVAWEGHYRGFLEMGNSYVRKVWIKNNMTLGRTITINKGSESVSGLAVDISDRGGLIVKLSNGVREEFLADDVNLGRDYYQNS